jgi:hypothetical protein
VRHLPTSFAMTPGYPLPPRSVVARQCRHWTMPQLTHLLFALPGPPRTPSSSSGHTRDGSPPSLPKPILPPIESIASPSDQYHWGFSSASMANSLRAGPLSPAMLSGPQQPNGDGTLAFDPSNFRTGLNAQDSHLLSGDPFHSHPRLLILRRSLT